MKTPRCGCRRASASDALKIRAEQIKAAPALDGAVDAGFITGPGIAKQDEQERLLNLVDIEALMAGADMRLVAPTLQ